MRRARRVLTVVAVAAAVAGIAVLIAPLAVDEANTAWVTFRGLFLPYPGIGPRSRRTKVRSELKSIYAVAEALYHATGRWPDSIEAMVSATSDDGHEAIASLERRPKDPWESEYVWTVEAGRARVVCLGSDNAPGGEGEAQDVEYPEPEHEPDTETRRLR